MSERQGSSEAIVSDNVQSLTAASLSNWLLMPVKIHTSSIYQVLPSFVWPLLYSGLLFHSSKLVHWVNNTGALHFYFLISSESIFLRWSFVLYKENWPDLSLTCFLRASNAALMVWTRVLSRALASSLLVCWMALSSGRRPGPSSLMPTRFLGDSWQQ